MAREVERATAAVARSMSSKVTGSVEEWPRITLPSESPTSSMSTPAASRMGAVRASYAVSIVRGMPSALACAMCWTRTRLAEKRAGVWDEAVAALSGCVM